MRWYGGRQWCDRVRGGEWVWRWVGEVDQEEAGSGEEASTLS